MKGYVLDLNTKHENSALSKPKNDITKILSNIGYKKLLYDATQPRFKRLTLGKFIWKKKLENVQNTTFIFQYPIYSRYISKVIMNELKKKQNLLKVIIVHDVESLRFSIGKKYDVKKEIKFFNKFDCLIIHNNSMKKWLLEHGVKKRMIILNLFDYLSSYSTNEKNLKLPLVYAGNLKKADFLINLRIETQINVFGPNPKAYYPANVSYRGQYSPENLQNHLNGSFGLVWDGESNQAGTGVYGNYTKYNNPYKVSSYFAAGLPVIVWNQAAISKFVESNQLGFAVNSLSEIDTVISNISNEQYAELKRNVCNINYKLKQSFFIKQALKKIIT